MPRITLDPRVQPDAWVDVRSVTLAGYNQEVLDGAVAAGLTLRQLQDEDDPGRLGLASVHQLALIHWQVQAWQIRNVDGEPLPAPGAVTRADLALVAEPVLAAVVRAADEARAGEPSLPPNGDAPSSISSPAS